MSGYKITKNIFKPVCLESANVSHIGEFYTKNINYKTSKLQSRNHCKTEEGGLSQLLHPMCVAVG